jgi:hypothetical protein
MASRIGRSARFFASHGPILWRLRGWSRDRSVALPRHSVSGSPDDCLLQSALDDTGKQPIPLSLMSLAAVVDEHEPWCLVDGNLEPDPVAAITAR